MAETADALVLDLVEWIAREPRPYAEVIATWRTSCPRLTIWEDAGDGGLVAAAGGERSGARGGRSVRKAGQGHRRRRTTAAAARPGRLTAITFARPEPDAIDLAAAFR